MLFRQIKYFVTVVDCNSFTEAAERCYISQSAVSQQIQALEHELGVQLLKRENRKFYLTPAGEYFYRCGQKMLDEARRVKAETVRIGQYGSRSLKAGYLKSYGGKGLHQAVAAFAQQHPEIELELMGGTHEELYDGLKSGRLDMVMNDQRRAFSDEYVNFVLLTCGWNIEIAAGHKLASGGRIELNELGDIPGILVADKAQQNKEREFYAHTLGFADNFLFALGIEEARLLAAAGKGYLLADGSGFAAETVLKRLPLYRNGSRIMRSYCAFWKKGNDNAYIPLFAELLKEKLQKENL